MKLGDYVENKKRELLQGGYRHVDFKRAEECEIGRNSTSYALFTAKQIPLDAEVEEVDRKTLPDDFRTMIPGVQIVLNVVKPRCRKPTNEYLYVKAM